MSREWIEGAAWPHLLPPLAEGGPAYRWVRWGGYEVSTAGDRRFSAMCAYLSDGRTIEAHFQCDVKGYDPGGTNWRVGKGKPPLAPDADLWPAYLGLWSHWAELNQDRMAILREAVDRHDGLLSDRFASTPINQAHALAVILNRSVADRLPDPVTEPRREPSNRPTLVRRSPPAKRPDPPDPAMPQATLF